MYDFCVHFCRFSSSRALSGRLWGNSILKGAQGMRFKREERSKHAQHSNKSLTSISLAATP